MVAFNFKPEFASMILAGTKVQTIRRTRRCGPGDRMQLFTGQRTSACVRIAERECVVSDYVHIAPDGLTLGNRDKHPYDIDDFARLDGFTDFADMQAWFAKQYGTSHFIGHVHRWSLNG